MLQDVPSDRPPEGRPFRDHHQVSPSLEPKQAGTRNRGRCEAGVVDELEPVVLSVDDEGGCPDGGDELPGDTGVSAQEPDEATLEHLRKRPVREVTGVEANQGPALPVRRPLRLVGDPGDPGRHEGERRRTFRVEEREVERRGSPRAVHEEDGRPLASVQVLHRPEGGREYGGPS